MSKLSNLKDFLAAQGLNCNFAFPMADAAMAEEAASDTYGIAINPTITGGTTATVTFDNGVDEATTLEVTSGTTAIVGLKTGSYTVAVMGATADVESVAVTTHAVVPIAITITAG